MPEATASSSAAAAAADSAPPSLEKGGFTGSGAAGAGSVLRGAAGSFFSVLDAALGTGAPDLALASIDSDKDTGVVWSGGVFIRSALCCFTEKKREKGKKRQTRPDYPSNLGSFITLSALMSITRLKYKRGPDFDVFVEHQSRRALMTLEQDDIDVSSSMLRGT